MAFAIDIMIPAYPGAISTWLTMLDPYESPVNETAIINSDFARTGCEQVRNDNPISAPPGIIKPS